MNEVFTLERAAEAYDHMMSGKAKFRCVLTTGNQRAVIPPCLFDILLFRRTANAIDDAEIKAAVRMIRLYDSGDGNEAKILSVADCTNTWFACKYIPAMTGPTEDPIR